MIHWKQDEKKILNICSLKQNITEKHEKFHQELKSTYQQCSLSLLDKLDSVVTGLWVF